MKRQGQRLFIRPILVAAFALFCSSATLGTGYAIMVYSGETAPQQTVA